MAYDLRAPPARFIWSGGDSPATVDGLVPGRWKGDTLVVDVTDFNGLIWFDRGGNFQSDALHVVERTRQ